MVRPGGAVAFTDWLETGQMNGELWTALHAFMAFPYMETLKGYTLGSAEEAGFRVVEQEDLSSDFADEVPECLSMPCRRPTALPSWPAMARRRTARWRRGSPCGRDASAAGQVGRGRIIALRP